MGAVYNNTAYQPHYCHEYVKFAYNASVLTPAARKIVATDLHKRKICWKFVPRSVTAEQKVHRVECCRSYTAFGDEDRNVLQTTAIGYKSWCFQFDPETKRRRMEWRGTESPRQKRVRLQKVRVKTTQNFFPPDAAGGIIHREFVPAVTNSKQALLFRKDGSNVCRRMRSVRNQQF